MASLTLLKDLEENFFLCSLCSDQFNEPKLLPCLHRYCSDCLKTIILASKEGKVNCSICKQPCVVPENGVDGFKTDFHMKNILDFLQLQKHLENKDVKECVGCLKETSVSAYCFKCREFLCDQCYNIHSTGKMFIDHRKRTLKLDYSERGTLTLEKLATLSENPRCCSHEEEFAKLCCTTCGNEPVCIICTYSDKHKAHALRDVSDIAQIERDLLKRNLDELIKHKNQIYELQKKTEASKQQLDENVSLKTEELIEQHRQQSDKVKRKFDDEKVARERGLIEIESRRKIENDEINIMFEDELKLLTQKYDTRREEAQTNFYNECQKFNENCDKIEDSLSSMQKKLDKNLQTLTTAAELLTTQNMQKLSKISDYFDQVIKRYENFTSTASSILAAEVDWTDVRCIPDLNTALEVLIEEMKKELPDVESLIVVDIANITDISFDYIKMTEQEEKVFEGILPKGWYIDAITSIGHDNIIISGSALQEHSHITVISKNGKIKRQDHIKSEKLHRQDGVTAERSCSKLKGLKIATVCPPDEFGIYDVSDGSYKKKTISDVISDSREEPHVVWCVTTDPVNNHILVGTDTRYVYAFDNQLNFSHTVTLPDITAQPFEMTVHGDSLLVCDSSSNKAYAVNMKGSKCEVLYELIPPEQAEYKWKPTSVCTDQNRFIYILWSAILDDSNDYDHDDDCDYDHGDDYDDDNNDDYDDYDEDNDDHHNGISRLVQYSQDGRHLLAMRAVDGAEWVTSLAETLLIATWKKIYIYGFTVA